MDLYGVPLFMSLLGFGMGTMLANFHVCGIMLVLRAVFNMLASPRGPVYFRCLMFNLFLGLGVLKSVVRLCKRCDRCCVLFVL